MCKVSNKLGKSKNGISVIKIAYSKQQSQLDLILQS